MSENDYGYDAMGYALLARGKRRVRRTRRKRVAWLVVTSYTGRPSGVWALRKDAEASRKLSPKFRRVVRVEYEWPTRRGGAR